jgi:hypothetical protein
MGRFKPYGIAFFNCSAAAWLDAYVIQRLYGSSAYHVAHPILNFDVPCGLRRCLDLGNAPSSGFIGIVDFQRTVVRVAYTRDGYFREAPSCKHHHADPS